VPFPSIEVLLMKKNLSVLFSGRRKYYINCERTPNAILPMLESLKIKEHSNSVITNPITPSTFVRYSRDIYLYNHEGLCSKRAIWDQYILKFLFVIDMNSL